MRASPPTLMLELRRTVALVAALPLFARAQSPRITPQGDPSVKADSIYRLAVDPKDYPDYPIAILLDDGVVRVESDGRTTKTYRTIVQILKPEAEQRRSEERRVGKECRSQGGRCSYIEQRRKDS